MQSIPSIPIEHATGTTKLLLESLQVEGGITSNMIKTMAHSSSALVGYLQFGRAVAGGTLTPKLRERIALTVAQTNRCDYSLAEHIAAARALGLTEDEILASRDGYANDEKTEALLKFVGNLTVLRGDYSAESLQRAGFSDLEIIEIVANVALNVFATYVNRVAKTDIDYPIEGYKVKAA